MQKVSPFQLIAAIAFVLSNDAHEDDEYWQGFLSAEPAGPPFRLITELDTTGEDVYIAGEFSSVEDVEANSVAKWDGERWQPLGSGFAPGSLAALVAADQTVYAGGAFREAGGITANSVAKWQNGSWSSLGSGISGVVDALAVNGDSLYAGGRFKRQGIYLPSILRHGTAAVGLR